MPPGWQFLLPAHPRNAFLQQSKDTGLNQVRECRPPSSWMSDPLLVWAAEKAPLLPRLGHHAVLHLHLLHVPCPGTLFMSVTSELYPGQIATTYELFLTPWGQLLS